MKHVHFGEWGHPTPHGKLPPFRFWVQQTLPSLYDDSLSYLELCSRISWYINQIINTLKVYDDKFCELMGLYKELEEYVRCYFDHADFPGMVKDILDDMAVTGKLSEILLQYIPDFAIDAKKIRGGIVAVQYTYDKTENGVEIFKKEMSDDDILKLLTNGSVIMGVFRGSPSKGTFASFMDYATWEYEGHVKEFECGCVNTVYTKDFTIRYEDYMLDDDNVIWQVVATDHYGDDATMTLQAVYANIKDGSVTTPKLADDAVTHPKLADDAVWSNNIKDGEVKTNDIDDGAVTPAKLAKGSTIFLGDGYDLSNGGWSAKVRSNLGITDTSKVAHAEGAGFVGTGSTFLSLLQGVASDISATDKKNVTNIVVIGGNDDRGPDDAHSANVVAAMVAFGNYVRSTFPNATVTVGQVAWRYIAIAGAGTWNNIRVTEDYMKGCGKAGFKFIDNSPFVLHDYSLFDVANGWKPSADGCDAIAEMVGIALAGGTYNKVGKRRQVAVSAASGLVVGPTAQNHMFPDDTPQTGSPTLWTYLYNDEVSLAFTSLHTIEFSTPRDLICHQAGASGYTGKFDLMTIDDPTQLYSQKAYNAPEKYIPCAVVDNSGTAYDCDLCVMYEGDKLTAFLYEGETVAGGNAKLDFKKIDDVKYIHWGADLGEFTVKCFDS